MPPDMLGPYQLLERLGAGGFAIVWRARHPTLHVDIALKVLKTHWQDESAEFRERFEREARAAAALRHPNIVTIHDLGEAAGQPYICMELVPGPSLDQHLAAHAPLPWDEALPILEQLASALDFAHAQGMVHRDVKPGNVLLDPVRGAVLTDFGFVRLGEASISLSRSGEMLGTPAYSAPEVWDGKASPASDQYALACIAVEMLTARRAFDAPTPPALMKQHLIDGPSLPGSWPEGVPRGVESVLLRALEKDSAARYTQVGRFVGTLRACEVVVADDRARAKAEIARRARLTEGAALLAGKDWSAALGVAAELLAANAEDGSAVRLHEKATEGLRAELAATEAARLARERKAARQQRLATLAERAETARAARRWAEARDLAKEWLDLDPDAARAAEIQAQAQRMLEGPPLRRTRSGLVIATPGNLNQLLALPEPPARIWWDRAGMELCLVLAGQFTMGINEDTARQWHMQYGSELNWFLDATPQHTVFLDAYYLSRHPVTQGQYTRFVREADHRIPLGSGSRARPYKWDRNRKRPPPGTDDHPVVLVSWRDAVAYCRWASLRLPSEAEWEKAASWDPAGMRQRIYPWGDHWDSRNCNSAEQHAGRELRTYNELKGWWDEVDNSVVHTSPVGSYSPAGDSPYGCADIAGNVWEWCADWHDADYYASLPRHIPQGPRSGTYRVVRGGSWSTSRVRSRSACRISYNPGRRHEYLGFRCCVSPMSTP